MGRILNIKKPDLLSTGLIKTRSGKLVCSILLVAFTVTVVSFSSVLMPSEVNSSADDRRQFQSGVDPISGSSEVFSPLFGGDELFVRDPAHLFPGSERIQGEKNFESGIGYTIKL